MAWSQAEIKDLIEDVRSISGPDLIDSRKASEEKARGFLNDSAGRMSEEDVVELGRFFNTGSWNGVIRHDRFAPAFHGATIKRLLVDMDLLNSWTRKLWSLDAEEALNALEEIARDTAVLPGAGRSWPSMLLYLRDPGRFAVWLRSTVRGLSAMTGSPLFGRAGGRKNYEDFSRRVVEFRRNFSLVPQEVDAVLSHANRRVLKAKARDKAEKVSPERASANKVATLPALAEETSLPIDTLETWVDLLNGPKRQAIFYGPPGTGKTFVAEKLALHLAGSPDRIATVQFHPSYSYEDFIEGLRPDPNATGIRYEIRPGVFCDFCDSARNDVENTYVFIIDELNRADLGSVLGELMLLLEYRGKEIQLPYSKRPLSIPPNLVLLASMNTADRSLALIDFALRRRFHAIQILPNRDVLAGSLLDVDGASLALKMFDLVQERVADKNFAPGHSYWMSEDVTAGGLLRVWDYELKPYLTEFWFEHPARFDELENEISTLLAEDE